MQYRREIDGLRAIAVVPVVLFHAGVAVFSGGYVGVDVFFVISGYLITSIILTELAAGTFTMWGFYERRARRILPALYLVVIVTVPFAWTWLSPNMLADFARSVAATALFLSNIHFLETTDYFATNTELQPLLHTWSLAVEEQFYLLFPPLLLLIVKLRLSRSLFFLCALAAGSFLVSEWGWRNEPDANFYFTFSRFWEILTGAVCAFLLFGKGTYSNDALASLGLATVLFSMIWLDETTPFPSFYTLAPVGGTALIILFAGTGTRVAAILSDKRLVGIGIVSFSFYLWHQPVFAFARMRLLQEPSLPIMLGLSLTSLALAFLSWRYVEKPFRRKNNPLLSSSKLVFAASGTGMALLVLFGVIVDQNEGAPFRLAPNGISYADMSLDTKLAGNYGLGPACSNGLISALAAPECRTSEDPSILLWGDSYAMHLGQWLTNSETAKTVGVQQVTKSQCWPILNVAHGSLSKGNAQECIAFNDNVLEWLTEQENISTIVLSSPFNATNLLKGREPGRAIDNQNGLYALAQIQETANALHSLGKRVIIVSPPPTSGADLGQCLMNASLWGRNLSKCDFTIKQYSSSLVKAYELLQKVDLFVPVFFLNQVLCSNEICRTSDDGAFIYRDTGHLSTEGSASLAQKTDLMRLLLSKAK